MKNNFNELIRLMRKDYKRKIEINKELSKLIETSSVKRYIELMEYNYPKIPLQEDIMESIINKYSDDINCEEEVLINKGIYLVEEGDYYNYSQTLIKRSDVPYIEKCMEEERQYNRHTYSDMSIENISYNLIKGESNYYGIDNPIVLSSIMFPSLQEIINNLKDYPAYNEFNKNIYYDKCHIARIQFYMMLMEENKKYVFEYYSNKKNEREIENKIDEYIKRKKLINKKTSHRLVIFLCGFSNTNIRNYVLTLLIILYYIFYTYYNILILRTIIFILSIFNSPR